MAITSGGANSVLELVKNIITFLTDETVFGTGNAWQLLLPATIDSIDYDVNNEIILKGVGAGTDEIYVGMKIKGKTGNIQLVLNGFAGYDPYLVWIEQPGGIPHTKLPTIPLVSDTYMTYWVTANTKRFIIAVQLSTQYEAAYLGLMTPIAVQKQYPYPLVIGGSYYEDGIWSDTSAGHSMFINPGSNSGASDNNTSLRIRRPDGTWRGGLNKDASFNSIANSNLNVWPTNTDPVRTLTVLDDTLTLENVIMFPMLLYENNPNGIIGQLDGVYWIGNREDLSSKDNIVYNGQIFKVFNNVFRRDNDQYFAIQWA